MLDTNIVSHIMRRDDQVVLRRLRELDTEDVTISAVTKGELLFGLARRSNVPVLTQAIREFLQTIAVLPWTDETAETYGSLRARCTARGIGLSALDMMIAAHAVSIGAGIHLEGLVATSQANGPHSGA